MKLCNSDEVDRKIRSLKIRTVHFDSLSVYDVKTNQAILFNFSEIKNNVTFNVIIFHLADVSSLWF